MSKQNNKKHKKGNFLGIDLHSNPKKGAVGFMMKKGITNSVVKAEIFLLAISVFCFSTSFYVLSESFPLK
jgi:hypothetical protein